MMMSPEVVIEHLKRDEKAVKSAGEKALERYTELSGRESKIVYEGDLEEKKSGGVVGSIMNGRIRVDNTLEERLAILEEKVSFSCACLYLFFFFSMSLGAGDFPHIHIHITHYTCLTS